MTDNGDTRRFRVPPEASGQVATHALLAAKKLRSFELYVEGLWGATQDGARGAWRRCAGQLVARSPSRHIGFSVRRPPQETSDPWGWRFG